MEREIDAYKLSRSMYPSIFTYRPWRRINYNGGPNSGATASSLAENEPSSGGHPLTTSGRHLNVCGDPSTS